MREPSFEGAIAVPQGRLPLRVPILAGGFIATLLLSLCFYWALLGEAPPVPRSGTSQLDDSRPYLFDIVLVDGAKVDAAEIAEIVQPLKMVLQRHMPGKKYHARIAVFGAGLQLSIDAQNAAAGYLAEVDSFFINLQHARVKRVPVSRPQWWGYIMGHEGMHLVQKNRGWIMRAGSRGPRYESDPIEIEAMREGATVANSLGEPFPWAYNGIAIGSEDPIVYSPFLAPSRPVEVIRVSTASTLRGRMAGTWHTISGQD